MLSFKKGELVWVKAKGQWEARYFSHENGGKYYCYSYQLKEGKTTEWVDIRKFKNRPF